MYSYPEVLNYNEYDNYVRNSVENRKDGFLNLRTDDIPGASYKKFHLDSHRKGKKVTNFFPDLPNIDLILSNMNTN